MELVYREREGGESFVESWRGARVGDAEEKSKKLISEGYSEIDRYNFGLAEVRVFSRGDELALFTYYESAGVLRLVTEGDSGYLSYLSEKAGADALAPRRFQPIFTQVDLDDFGLSNLIKLPDGRFVIFDGGWDVDSHADNLINTLTEQSNVTRPVIAAWIMTHPHIDHYRCYLNFARRYEGRVEIENFIYNFPDPDPTDERFAIMAKGTEFEHVAIFNELVAKSGARFIRAHTGEVFDFAGVKFEILSSPDDVIYVPIKNMNDYCLVFKVYAEGQALLLPGDAQFCNIDLADRLGEYLKADILQVHHHFFSGGDVRSFDLISPSVLVVPSTDEISFSGMSIFKNEYGKTNEHLLYNVGANECLTGGNGNIVLKLPYKSPEGARERMYARIEAAKKSIGATSWYFDGITADEAEFTFINSVWEENTVYADLIFENSDNNVVNIKFTIPKRSMKKLNILTDESIDPDNIVLNRMSLKKRGGVPDGVEFTVHIKTKKPIVVSGKKPAIYYS